jgi:cyclic-di-AMP phosphodiesterase PgpH
MPIFDKKVNQRRQKFRETKTAERAEKIKTVFSPKMKLGLFFAFLFVLAATFLLSFELFGGSVAWVGAQRCAALFIIISLITATACAYVVCFKRRVAEKPLRALSICTLFLVLLTITRAASMDYKWLSLVTGTAVVCAVILAITYDRRFALGMSLFYVILAALAAPPERSAELFAVMMAGVAVCCFSLQDIRTRMKLIEVSTYSAMAVVAMSLAFGMLKGVKLPDMIGNAGSAGFVTFFVGVIIQGFLPVIERIFNIATSTTLLFYSDANQPLLRKLAIEAPGTYSHSLLIGSIAEKAAEAIGSNGLLARVGCYYHDVGKIQKADYFVENQNGAGNKHDSLSPAMSNLVITNHIKNGTELAREYGIPPLIRDFISTHHGTTVVKYFYEQAKRKAEERGETVSANDFRYPGPKPQTKEQAIVMLIDGCEGAVRAAQDLTQPKISGIVHSIAMQRLQDGQFDDCDMTLKELSFVENEIIRSLAAHHHGRIAYPDSDEGNGQNSRQKSRKAQKNKSKSQDRPQNINETAAKETQQQSDQPADNPHLNVEKNQNTDGQLDSDKPANKEA